MKEKIEKWLSFEKEDLDKRIRTYPKFRGLLLLSVVFGFLVSFFWLWTKTANPLIRTYDFQTISLIDQIKTPWLTDFFQGVTFLGSEAFMTLAVFLLALVLVAKNRKRAAAVTLFTLAGSVFFIYFFKSLFGRARPIGCLADGDCLSFPSGHATLSFYFYGLIGYLIFRFLPVSNQAYFLISSFIMVLVILVSFSRLFLGVHYLSDIFGGFFLGGSWLLFAILLIDVFYTGID